MHQSMQIKMHHLAAAFCQNMTNNTLIIRNMLCPYMSQLHYFAHNWLEIITTFPSYHIAYSTEYVAKGITITFLSFIHLTVFNTVPIALKVAKLTWPPGFSKTPFSIQQPLTKQIVTHLIHQI